jgi:hypothetical protein
MEQRPCRLSCHPPRERCSYPVQLRLRGSSTSEPPTFPSCPIIASMSGGHELYAGRFKCHTHELRGPNNCPCGRGGSGRAKKAQTHDSIRRMARCEVDRRVPQRSISSVKPRVVQRRHALPTSTIPRTFARPRGCRGRCGAGRDGQGSPAWRAGRSPCRPSSSRTSAAKCAGARS